MTVLTKDALSQRNTTDFANNTTKKITEKKLRDFNTDLIDTLFSLGSGPVVAKFANVVHISDYAGLGAFGTVPHNGTVSGEDCKQAIDAAVLQVSSAGGKGRKLIMDGCIYPTSPLAPIVGGISNNFTWEGDGQKGTYIRLRPNSNAHLCQVVAGAAKANSVKGTVQYIGFDGNRDQQSSLGDWDAFRLDLDETATGDPAWFLMYGHYFNACRDGLYVNGRGDHRIMYNDMGRNGRNGLRVGKLYDSKIIGNILPANGECGIYAEVLAGCTLGLNKPYFNGYNTRGGISQDATDAGKRARRRLGSGYLIEYAARVKSFYDEVEDELGNGWTIDRVENCEIHGPILNSAGTQGRDYNVGGQYANLTRPQLELTDPSSGVYMFEFGDSIVGNLKITDGRISSPAPTTDRGGQWVMGAVHFEAAGTANEAKRRGTIDIEISGTHPSNHGQYLPMDGPRVVRVTLASAAWQGGSIVRLTGPYMSYLSKQIGQTLVIPQVGGVPAGLVGTPWTIAAQNNGLTYIDITVPGASAALNFTGTFVADVSTYQFWAAPFSMDAGLYSDQFEAIRLRWNGRDVGFAADMDVKDTCAGVVNPFAGRFGLTTRPRQTRTITGVARQANGNTRLTLNALTSVTQARGAAASVAGLSGLLNGVFEAGAASAGSSYLEVAIPNNLTAALDGTGLSGTLLFPYDSAFTTVDGSLETPIVIVYGKSVDASNKARITFHKYREADGSVTAGSRTLDITATGQEVPIRWDGGAWSIVQPTKRAVVANPSGASLTAHFAAHVVRITGATDGTATLGAGLFEGQDLEILVYQASTGALSLTVPDLLGGAGTATLAAGRHVYRWEKWDGTNLKWRKVV